MQSPRPQPPARSPIPPGGVSQCPLTTPRFMYHLIPFALAVARDIGRVCCVLADSL